MVYTDLWGNVGIHIISHHIHHVNTSTIMLYNAWHATHTEHDWLTASNTLAFDQTSENFVEI